MRHILSSSAWDLCSCPRPRFLWYSRTTPLLRRIPARSGFITMSYSAKCTPGSRYHYIEDVERLERYQPGGYHPIFIGDVLLDRYQVVHKLGYGTYSTIWLVFDRRQAAYSALKICTADAPQDEVRILQALSKPQPGCHSRGRGLIPENLDQFELHGPNGRHRCYVTSPARSSIADAKFNCYFSIETARVLVAQLILAVAFIHAHGLVHGDIHLGNTLLRLPSDFNNLTTEEFYKRFGEPRKEDIVRFDKKRLSPNVPSYGVVPVWLGMRAKMILPSEAYLILSDFGEAFFPATHQRPNKDCHAPLPVVPPEGFFELDQPISFSVDIWTLACAIWSICGMRPLFDGTLATKDDIISQHVDILGLPNFPMKWWNAWEAKGEYFDQAGQPKNGRTVILALASLFEEEIQRTRREDGMDVFGKEEAVAILAMLRTMLVFKPEERATAEEVLASRWMVDWGLPELQKQQKWS